MNLKSNKIGKERMDMLRENEVIVGLIAVDVVQAFIMFRCIFILRSLGKRFGNLLNIVVENSQISYHTLRYLRGHRGDRELRPCNFNNIINFSVDSVVSF